jgi:Flp pilus assembly pilin Flp
MAMRPRQGQSTVEMMLLISVIAIAMVAISYALVPDLEAGLLGQQDVVKTMVGDGLVDGGT